MALWKCLLLFVAPSLFVLANVAYNLGAAAAKALAIQSHRQERRPELWGWPPRRTYRLIGWIVLGVSLFYIVGSLELVFGAGQDFDVSPFVAILIATASFTELTIAVVNILNARREDDLLIEALRFVKLAGAFLLLVLTQTALLTAIVPKDLSVYNGAFGILMGTLSAGVGIYMLLHRLPPYDEGTGGASDQPIGDMADTADG